MWDALSCYAIGLRDKYSKDSNIYEKKQSDRDTIQHALLQCQTITSLERIKFIYLTTWEMYDAKL